MVTLQSMTNNLKINYVLSTRDRVISRTIYSRLDHSTYYLSVTRAFRVLDVLTGRTEYRHNVGNRG